MICNLFFEVLIFIEIIFDRFYLATLLLFLSNLFYNVLIGNSSVFDPLNQAKTSISPLLMKDENRYLKNTF